VTLRGIRVLSRRRDRDERKNQGRTQGEQHNGAMLVEAIHNQSACLVHLVCLVCLICLIFGSSGLFSSSSWSGSTK
jgi:hypothetical protein